MTVSWGHSRRAAYLIQPARGDKWRQCSLLAGIAIGKARENEGWDSCDDGRARFTPHTAFTLPNTPATVRPRESIEVLTLVVWD